MLRIIRILAQTQHSVVAAPYHRLSWGILAANSALSASPGKDEQAVRALKAQYIVTCPARLGQTARLRSSTAQKASSGGSWRASA